MSIAVKDITKVFGEQKVIKNISFEVKTGEIVGFLGPNGAGKSTTMKIITGFLPPTTGTVLINGQEQNIDNTEIKKNIGYLPENNPLYLDLYVQEFLTFILGFHNITKNDRNAKIKKIMSLCGLEKEQHKKIGMLSKGYRQRVGLAAALIHDPNVLILDEPTTGLDPNQIIDIRELIKTVSKDKTVLFSSHIMQEVEAICDRVIILNEGDIVANNTMHELTKIKSGISYKVVFSSPITDEVISNCLGVISFNKSDECTFIINTDSNDDISSEFFDIAIANNSKIIHLTQEQKNLETLFRELTKQ